MALSTTEAKYIATSTVVYQLVWIKGILESIKHKQKWLTTLFYENRSTISIAKAPI